MSWQSSGEVLGSAVITNKRTRFFGVLVTSDGSNDVTVNVYNNTKASGTKLCPQFVVKAANQEPHGVVGLNAEADNGIYIDLSTAGTARAVVYHGQEW